MTLQQILTHLISCSSISPDDAGCQDYLADYLEKLGFICTRFDSTPVSNLYAQYGTSSPLLMFAGHTDVVPPGPLSAWDTPPFELIEKNGLLFGRGVADMKGSLAAMMVVAKRFVERKSQGSLAFLITSGEEGNDFEKGTPHVMKALTAQGIHPDYCIVGEPSSDKFTGDTIKIGRRGSLTAHITLQGKQGHVAYPQLADNPIHKMSHALKDLATLTLDEGNAYFPPSSLQLTHIHSGGEAGNIIPGELTLDLNIRFSTEQTVEKLKAQITQCFTQYDLTPKINWRLNGEPFLTNSGKLLDTSLEIIKRITGKTPTCSTTGGTSDGRFIAPYGVDVIELGPCNGTIHQVNECVTVQDLEILIELYDGIVQAINR